MSLAVSLSLYMQCTLDWWQKGESLRRGLNCMEVSACVWGDDGLSMSELMKKLQFRHENILFFQFLARDNVLKRKFVQPLAWVAAFMKNDDDESDLIWFKWIYEEKELTAVAHTMWDWQMKWELFNLKWVCMCAVCLLNPSDFLPLRHAHSEFTQRQKGRQ